MNIASPQFKTTLSLVEMETFIRRAVQEAVREELARLLRHTDDSIVENWAHEGPEDPAGDQLLLAEAIEERDRYSTNPEAWMGWEAFKAELAVLIMRLRHKDDVDYHSL
ncbi:MAG: hypothetical protein WAW20_09455 [Anaerolineae bacterium]